MTNKQILVLNRLAAIAQAVNGINYVGDYHFNSGERRKEI